jgi:hypothetical protein
MAAFTSVTVAAPASLAALCFAAAPPDEPPSGSGDLLQFLIPLVLLLLLLLVFPVLVWVVVMATSQRKRAYQHMERLEAKTDRMIALLESIADGLRREKGPPGPSGRASPQEIG